jgi:hypothetical protein
MGLKDAQILFFSVLWYSSFCCCCCYYLELSSRVTFVTCVQNCDLDFEAWVGEKHFFLGHFQKHDPLVPNLGSKNKNKIQATYCKHVILLLYNSIWLINYLIN